MGKIEVITGPMYAGKTEELIRRVRRTIYTKQKCVVFKHSFDTRYSSENVVTHDGQKIECITVKTANDLLKNLNNLAEAPEIIAIDEVQFFDGDIVNLVSDLANQRKRVIVAGLDMDYKGLPFGPMPQLLAITDDVAKLRAVCSICGNDALFSKRTVDCDGTILVGAKDEYIAVCREHFKN